MLVLTNEECILKKYTTWFILISVGNISLHVLYLCLSVLRLCFSSRAHIAEHVHTYVFINDFRFCARVSRFVFDAYFGDIFNVTRLLFFLWLLNLSDAMFSAYVDMKQ